MAHSKCSVTLEALGRRLQAVARTIHMHWQIALVLLHHTSSHWRKHGRGNQKDHHPDSSVKGPPTHGWSRAVPKKSDSIISSSWLIRGSTLVSMVPHEPTSLFHDYPVIIPRLLQLIPNSGAFGVTCPTNLHVQQRPQAHCCSRLLPARNNVLVLAKA